MKLNLGCGKYIYEGFDNLDLGSNHPDVINQDITDLSNYPDGSVEEVIAFDVLEHFPLKDVLRVLAEWCRTIMPGGKIQIKTTSSEIIFDIHYQQAKQGIISWERFSQILYGSQTTPYMFHYVCFQFDWLKEMLEECGMENVKFIKRCNMCMLVEATKKETENE